MAGTDVWNLSGNKCYNTSEHTGSPAVLPLILLLRLMASASRLQEVAIVHDFLSVDPKASALEVQRCNPAS